MAFTDDQIRLKALTEEHEKVSGDLQTFYKEWRGKETPAEEEQKIDGLMARMNEIELESKAVNDRVERENNVRRRMQDAEDWRKKAGAMLPNLSSGHGGDPEREEKDNPFPGIEFKDGFAVTQTRATHGVQTPQDFRLVSEDDWKRNAGLSGTSTKAYRESHRSYLRGLDYDVKALLEGVDTAGGYSVPPDFLATVITRVPGIAVVEDRATVRNTMRDRVEVRRMKASTTDTTMYTSNVRFTMVGEVAGTAETEPAWELLGVPVWTAKLETELGRNMVADSAFDVEGYLTEEYQRAATLGKDDKFLTGTGIHEPVGIMMDSEVTDVATGHATEITADGWVNLIFDLPAQYAMDATVWMSRSARKDTAKLKDASGAYLFDVEIGTGRIGGGRPRTILGEPYIVTDFVDAVGAGNKPAGYGNLRYYWVYNRLALSVQVLREQPYAGRNAFGYIAYLRFAGHVSVPEAFRRMVVQA